MRTRMSRRSLLLGFAAMPFLSSFCSRARAATPAPRALRSGARVRPGDPGWPAEDDWSRLNEVPGLVLTDDRAGAPAGNVFWASNLEEAGREA